MKPTVEQLGDLLALKRDERPEEGYWQDFLCEFHQRQREDAVKRWTPVGVWQRMSRWFSEMETAKWWYGAGLGYAAIMVAFLTFPRGVEVESAAPIKVNHQVVPAPAPTVEQLDELDLGPATQGNSGEQVF